MWPASTKASNPQLPVHIPGKTHNTLFCGEFLSTYTTNSKPYNIPNNLDNTVLSEKHTAMRPFLLFLKTPNEALSFTSQHSLDHHVFQ